MSNELTTMPMDVTMDDGRTNTRILKKAVKADFRHVESASLKVPVRFMSAEGKRLFVRHFNTLQANMHFISFTGRIQLGDEVATKIENAVRVKIDYASAKLNKAIDRAEALYKTNGISATATYDTVPLDVLAGVLSSLGRRYLEVIGKLDQLMPLLETLEILEVLDQQQVDRQRATAKRDVKAVSLAARYYAAALRRQVSALGRGAQGAPGASGSRVSSAPESYRPATSDFVPAASEPVDTALVEEGGSDRADCQSELPASVHGTEGSTDGPGPS
jgi:hypothetical protein